MALVGFKPDLNDRFLIQCFDTVGLVIWPLKIVPEMTGNVLSGKLSLYTTTGPTRPCRGRFVVSRYDMTADEFHCNQKTEMKMASMAVTRFKITN